MGKRSALMLLIVLLPLATGCSPIASPLAYMDHRQCLKVSPGMTEQQVIDLMGQPQSRETSNGLWLYYREEFGSSGPIVVVFSDHGGAQKVQTAACDGLG